MRSTPVRSIGAAVFVDTENPVVFVRKNFLYFHVDRKKGQAYTRSHSTCFQTNSVDSSTVQFIRWLSDNLLYSANKIKSPYHPHSSHCMHVKNSTLLKLSHKDKSGFLPGFFGGEKCDVSPNYYGVWIMCALYGWCDPTMTAPLFRWFHLAISSASAFSLSSGRYTAIRLPLYTPG